MAILSKAGITSGSLIEASQITQIIDAFTASGSVIDISITGSLSVEGTTNLGKLGKNTQSPLIFNPDAQGNSVFYAKNPSGTFTIGTGANPYAGSDLITLSPLGALGVAGNLNVVYTASAGSVLVSGNTGLGTTTPQARLSVSNNGSQSIEMDYSAVLNANYIESYNRSSSAPLDLVYYISPGTVGSHRFYTNGGQRMVVNRDGNVGIGTTAPTVPLNVSGDTIITGSTTLFNNGGTLELRGTNHSYIQWYPDNSTRRAYFGFAASGSTNIILENENASGNIAIVTNHRFVGINKHTPTSPLDVNGNATITGSITATSDITSAGIISSPTMTTTNFSSTNLTVGSSTVLSGSTTLFGNAGLLDIKGTDHAYIEWYPDNTTRKAYFGFASSGSKNIILENENASGNIVLVTNSGFIGINKYTPTTALEVGGNISASADIITDNGFSTRSGIINLGGTFTTRTGFIADQPTYLEISKLTANPMYFSTNSSVRMTIASNGRIGIGTTSPNTRLSVADNAYPSMQVESSWTASGQIYSGIVVGALTVNQGAEMGFVRNIATAANSFYHVTPYGQVQGTMFAIRPNGNVGIGISAPNQKLAIIDNALADTSFFSNTNASFTSATIVPATTRASGTDCFFIYGTANSFNTFQVYNNGNVKNQNNSYLGISDIKLKENIVDTTPKLEKLKQVRVVNYNFKEDLGFETFTQLGVIAQELEQIFPGLVEETPDRDAKGKILKTTTKSVKYSVFVPMLIKAIQEQQVQIEELKSQVATLISGSL